MSGFGKIRNARDAVEHRVDQQLAEGTGDQRDSDRTAMFVAATLCEDKATHTVRIRNMSPNGALIEGASLAPAGSAVALVRADLSATGHVAWVHRGRSGIALDHDVDVTTWMSVKAHVRQQEVDRLVRDVRAQLRDAEAPLADLAGDLQPTFEQGAALPTPGASDEVILIAALLSRLEDQLLEDPRIVERHVTALQAIDEAQQRLHALAAKLRV